MSATSPNLRATMVYLTTSRTRRAPTAVNVNPSPTGPRRGFYSRDLDTRRKKISLNPTIFGISISIST